MSERLRKLFTLRRLCIAYVVALLLALVFMEWRAESWLPFAFLLYAPPLVLLAPLAILFPLALWKERWALLLMLAVCAPVVLFGHARWRFASPGKHAAALTVITHNVGGGNRAAFADSFPGETPGVILLQEIRHADRLERDYMKRYPTFQSRGIEQFMLLTPHMIEDAAPVPGILWQGKHVAVRCVLRIEGRSVAIYNVHLPTPRNQLTGLLRPRALLEVLWLGSAETEDFPSYRAWLDARVALARQLAGVFEKETLPFLVGGDFNMPDHGIVYHTFASRLADAHAKAGRGWGFTFPGAKETRIASLLGPWLRLDYWFAGRGWTPIECRTAADARSQHRAVLARFAPTP